MDGKETVQELALCREHGSSFSRENQQGRDLLALNSSAPSLEPPATY